MEYQPSEQLKTLVKDKGIRIIGITGQMMSGKDTTAEFIQFAFCHSTRITWFAYALKQMMIEYFGFTYDDLYTTEGKKRYNEFWDMTNREALQKIGTECFRNNFHKDTWLKTMEVNILKHPDKLIIIPDVRFPNEAALIRSLDGILLKIVRNTNRDDQQMQHASETEINNIRCDAQIVNQGTRQELFETVLTTLHYLGIMEQISLSPRLPGSTLDRVLEAEYFAALKQFTGTNYPNPTV